MKKFKQVAVWVGILLSAVAYSTPSRGAGMLGGFESAFTKHGCSRLQFETIHNPMPPQNGEGFSVLLHC